MGHRENKTELVNNYDFIGILVANCTRYWFL